MVDSISKIQPHPLTNPSFLTITQSNTAEIRVSGVNTHLSNRVSAMRLPTVFSIKTITKIQSSRSRMDWETPFLMYSFFMISVTSSRIFTAIDTDSNVYISRSVCILPAQTISYGISEVITARWKTITSEIRVIMIFKASFFLIANM